MPLLKGSSNDIVSENVREMRKAGHPEAQAVAASLRAAGRGRKSGSKQSPNKIKKASKVVKAVKAVAAQNDVNEMVGDA